MKIIIRSMSRSEGMTTHKLLKNYVVCVPESERDAYAKIVGHELVITHPDSVIGLNAKNNWMIDNIKDSECIVLLDDDLTGFVNNTYPQEESELCVIHRPEHIEEVIYNTFLTANDMGAKLFGWAGYSAMRMHYTGCDPFTLTGYICGSGKGLINGHGIRFDEKMIGKEDYFASLMNAYLHRICFRDDRYVFEYVKTFKNSGGMSKIRNSETEKTDIEMLRKKFGNAVQEKKLSPIRPREYMGVGAIKITLPF